MKRAKYKAKNIHAFKRIFECSVPGCTDHGIVTYAEEPDNDKDLPVTIRRCIPHVHWTKEPAVKQAKNPNLYTKCEDIAKLLDLNHYNVTREVIKHTP